VRSGTGGVYLEPNFVTLECDHADGVGMLAPAGVGHVVGWLLKISWGVLSEYETILRRTRVTSDGKRKPCEYLEDFQ
jgi:hypothetical protein